MGQEFEQRCGGMEKSRTGSSHEQEQMPRRQEALDPRGISLDEISNKLEEEPVETTPRHSRRHLVGDVANHSSPNF